MNKPNKTELEYFIRYSLDSDKYKRYMELYEEIERLNNIINNLINYIGQEWYCFDNESVEFYVAKDILNKLQELKGVELTENDKKQVKWLKEEFKVRDNKE